MPERDAAVDHQALALVEHRAVRGVVVRAIHPARRDHPQRRRLLQHGDNLHVAGLRPQQQRPAVARAGQIERVVVRPRRVVRRDVQRGEVEPVGLHVQPLANREAHGAEDGRHLLHRARQRMDRARRMGQGRQGHVDPLPRQPRIQRRRVQLGPARLDHRCQLVLEHIQPRPTLPSDVVRNLAEFLQHPGQPPLLTQCANAHGVPGAQVGAGGERRGGLGPQGV